MMARNLEIVHTLLKEAVEEMEQGDSVYAEISLRAAATIVKLEIKRLKAPPRIVVGEGWQSDNKPAEAYLADPLIPIVRAELEREAKADAPAHCDHVDQKRGLCLEPWGHEGPHIWAGGYGTTPAHEPERVIVLDEYPDVPF